MTHNHIHQNNDVLIYNIKYINDGKYIVRFASKNEVNENDYLASLITLRTPNNFFEVICTQVIEQKKNNNDYFVCIAEFSDPLFNPKDIKDNGQNNYVCVEMNAKHLDKFLVTN